MAKTTRQTSIFGVEDWKKIYKTFSDADLQSYDFETLRKSFIDYIKLNYPESFNDFVESSEYISLLDLIAFMGQSLSYRVDLNARENFIDTAERRDSVTRLAKLVGYTPKRNTASVGYVKIDSVATSESVVDTNGNNISNVVINWNDSANPFWRDQFNTVINAALIDSQKIGKAGNRSTILSEQIDEYTINLVQGNLPIFSFNTTVDSTAMTFELTSATAIGKNYLYEPAPRPDGMFNILYKVDGLGFGSSQTGFFVRFRQGSLQSYEFTLPERLPNQSVSISTDGVNDEDIWLFETNGTTITSQWYKVDNVQTGRNPTDVSLNKVFSVNSRANDQVDLVFGDGVFSAIPVNTMRAYYRVSNGLQYTINNEEMQSIQVPIPYVSRYGRVETLTLTVSLVEPVNNSLPRESIADIKARAPQRFYTQNRMVNGEDYNIFPYTLYSSILKSKAVNRSSIGISRYLDLVDSTSRYSSTNIFAADGMLFRDEIAPSFSFTFTDINDVSSIIIDKLEPMLRQRSLSHFYYAQYTNRTDLTSIDLQWNSSTISTNNGTGYFKINENPQPIGSYVSDNKKYIKKGALIKFVSPSGMFFGERNMLITGVPTKDGERTYIWSTVTSVVLDGTNFGLGNMDSGAGPVTLNNVIPDGAYVEQVIPGFVTDVSLDIEQQIKDQILIYKDFGLRYDNLLNKWAVITSNNLDYTGLYSTAYAGSDSNTNLDASWVVKFTTDGSRYTVEARGLNYYFASERETRFFFDGLGNIYDPKTGSVVNDFIKILKSNSQPDTNTSLGSDLTVDIIGQEVESDGYSNDAMVLIGATDKDADGVPDDPDFYEFVVDTSTNITDKIVFLERTAGSDNLIKLVPVKSTVINKLYATSVEIVDHQFEYDNNTCFYAYDEDKFYILNVDIAGNISLVETTKYVAKIGRQNLYFQYQHNSPNTRRVDPGTTNIIELFLVTSSYYTNFQKWIQDSTSTVTQPLPPTIDELELEYSRLNQYKMVSDSIVLNSATFKPLFGSKADSALQATIRVVKLAGVIISTSEIQSRVISEMNAYFSLDNWDFGDTFYFSELSAYLHARLGSIISSVVIVPKSPLLQFGSLFEVKSRPNEIFVNAATVDDIEVVTTLSAATLNTSTTNKLVI